MHVAKKIDSFQAPSPTLQSAALLCATTLLPHNAVPLPPKTRRFCLFLTFSAGVDIFNMGTIRKVGCPQDPRPVLSTKACGYSYVPSACSFGFSICRETFFTRACLISNHRGSGAGYVGGVCNHGILNKERGLPYCKVVPLKTDAGASGFVAAISEM